MGGWNKGKIVANWEQKVKDKFGDSFELVSNEPAEKGERLLTVRCRVCGTEKEVKSISFRGRFAKSGHCEVCSMEQTKNQRQNEIDNKFNKKIRIRLKTKQVGFRFCECGAILAYKSRYCLECKEKHKKQYQKYKYNKEISSKAEKKRLERLKGVKSDKDATLKAIYEKYNGICYLCGQPCNWDDGRWVNGVFKVGGSYPSREHIMPLSKGGDDTWSNLRLAHVSCNAKKGNRPLNLYPLVSF